MTVVPIPILIWHTLQYIRNRCSHPPAPQEPHEETLDEEYNTTEEIDPAISHNLADIGVLIPGPPNYQTSEIFHHEQNERVPPSPRTIARARLPQTQREVVEGLVQIVPPRGPAYDSWAHYFQEHPEMRTNWQSRPRPLPSMRPLQVRPPPRPFTPHLEPEVVDETPMMEIVKWKKCHAETLSKPLRNSAVLGIVPKVVRGY